MNKYKKWYDYLWIITPIYFGLGFFNILFAWIGLFFFLAPLLISIFGGGKFYCNLICDRGRFLALLGKKLRLSRNKPMPKWLKSKYFRYGFLVFFLIMFSNMIWATYLVAEGSKALGLGIKLFWVFKVPWAWAYPVEVTPWIAKFAFGFYSIMLTSTLLGMIVMVLYKPRAWCVFCPMGTMTQLISRLRYEKSLPDNSQICYTQNNNTTNQVSPEV